MFHPIMRQDSSGKTPSIGAVRDLICELVAICAIIPRDLEEWLDEGFQLLLTNTAHLAANDPPLTIEYHRKMQPTEAVSRLAG